MNRAPVEQLRQGMECARLFANAGIGFVCMPVMDQAEYIQLQQQCSERMAALEAEATAEEEQEAMP